MTKKDIEKSFKPGSQAEQDYQEMLALFQTEIVDNLPKIPAKATVKSKVTLKKGMPLIG